MNGARKTSLPGIFFFPPLITDLTFFVQKAIKESDPTISNKVRRLVLQMFKSQVSQRSWCPGSQHDQQRLAISDTTRDHYSLSLKQQNPMVLMLCGTTDYCPDAVWSNILLFMMQ